MPIPKECKMPNLSILEPLLPRLIPVLLVGERGKISKKVALYRRNFIRLVDKALREYKEAREHILAEVEESKLSPKEIKKKGQHIYAIGFTDYLENCINAVSRLYRLLERIKSEKDTSLPKIHQKLLNTKYNSIANVRNAIEHIDVHIQKDELSPGNPIMLAINERNDGVVISKFEINFNDLATIIKNMHEVALDLLSK
jgi:hypothetical protein